MKEIFVVSKVNKSVDGELYMAAWHEDTLKDAEDSVRKDFMSDCGELGEDLPMDEYLHECGSCEFYFEFGGEETRWKITRMTV